MTQRSVKTLLLIKSRINVRRSCAAGGEARDARHEEGWALLGLLLALGVMSIFLTSAIVPNVQKEVQRDKEIEMLYRGQQMAEGIARYYGRGRLSLIVLSPATTAAWPYLTDLVKLRDGVNLGPRELKFVRPSALIDPIANSEWEPIRLRDPRLAKFLQAWAAETLNRIPDPYPSYAAAPLKTIFKDSDSSSSSHTSGSATQSQPTDSNPTGQGAPGRPRVVAPGQQQNPDDPDDDDDDPFADLFGNDQPGHSNLPILGVVSKKKGQAINAYFGLTNYEDWVFIYIPKNLPGVQNQFQNQQNIDKNNNRLRVSP